MTAKLPIKIRSYQVGDAAQIEQLFYDTVHAINRRDYTEKQVEIWAEQGKINRLSRPLENSYAYVAEVNGQIVGFADINSTGYLDRLYVHKDFQRRGIAAKLLDVLETKARDLHLSKVTVDASITAKPFFLANGYSVEEEQSKIVQGISFTNFKMHKRI